MPDFGVHAQLGFPPLPTDPFWPGSALGFNSAIFGLPPNAAAALGLPWSAGGKIPSPSFHNILSQYMLANGGLGLPSGFSLTGFHIPTHSSVMVSAKSQRWVYFCLKEFILKSLRVIVQFGNWQHNFHYSNSDSSVEPDLDIGNSDASRSPPPTPSTPPSISAENRRNSIESLRMRAKEHVLDQNHQRLLLQSTSKSATVTS